MNRDPERDREDAYGVGEDAWPILGQHPQQRFSVGAPAEHVTARAQPAPKELMVIELAVVREPEAVARGHRLMPCGGRIDDRKPSVAQAYGTIEMNPLIVGTTVFEPARHPPQLVGAHRATRIVVVKNAGDAAHDWVTRTGCRWLSPRRSADC